MSAEKWVIDKSTLEDIGDAIRTKEGSSDDIPVTELKPRILAIQTGADTTDATASDGDVLSGETFYADGEKKTGTMPNNGAVSPSELSAGGSYTIPAGYHNGGGKVTAKDLASQTSATAGAGDIRDGKTAWVGGSKVAGEMPVNSPSNKELPWTITTMPQGDGDATIKVPVTAGYYEEGQYPSTALPMKFQSDITPGTSDITVPGGAYFPSGFKVKGDSDLVAENIKNGVEIFGKTGTYTSDATATAEHILSGKTAYVNGDKITGKISSKGVATYTPGTSAQYIDPGVYISGTQTIKGDSNLKAANIKNGSTIFGVTGTYTSDATAAAGDIVSGKTAYVNGSKITGNMTDQGTKTATLDTSATSYTIPAGKHSGSGKVSITTQEKSVTPTSSAQTITPDSGKVLSKVTVAAASGGSKTGSFVGTATTTRSINVGVTLSNTDKFFLWCSSSATSFQSAVIDVWCEGSSDTSLRSTDSSGVLKNPEYDGVTYSGSTVTITSKSGSFASGYMYQWILLKG